jgi:hypothetical protein
VKEGREEGGEEGRKKKGGNSKWGVREGGMGEERKKVRGREE